MSTSDTTETIGPDSDHETGPADETWVYGGSRTMRGKRVHLWITNHGHGDELLYSKTRASAVGALYIVAVARTDDSIIVHGTPRYHGTDGVDPDLLTRLHAEHHAAQVRLAQARQERQTAKRDQIRDLLAPLQAIMRALPTRADREAFIAHVLTELAHYY